MSNLVWPSSMPYDDVTIIDESEYSDITVNNVTGVPTGPIAYIPFVSPRGYGSDNELVYINSSRVGNYGNPNLSKYGLTLYLVNRFIAGGGTVLGKRIVPPYVVTPEEITAGQLGHGKSYSNVGIYAIVKNIPASEGVTAVHTITYGKYVITAPNQGDDLVASFANMTATQMGITLAENETLYKLFVIKSKAAGDYANKFAFLMTNDSTMNTTALENSWAAHFYHYADTDDNYALDKDMVFTFADDITYEGESMDPENVFDAYSENVEFKKCPGDNGLVKFMTAINADGSADFILADTFVDTTSVSWTITHDVFNNTLQFGGACSLINGDYVWKTEADRDTFSAILVDAYDYTTDDMILNKVRYPYQYMFAPTFDENVVAKMSELAGLRDITHVIYMFPEVNTYSAAITYLNGTTSLKAALNDFRAHAYCEWAYWKDSYTGKKTKFPIQYALAYQMPNHWINAKGTPYAGSANFTITGFVTGTMRPMTSSDTQRINNHNARINTVEEDGFGNAVPYEQITGKEKISALSECNNSFILTDMVRIALKVSDEKRWSYLTNDEIDNFKKLVSERISSELGSCYQSVEIICNRESINGAGRNRIECYITVYFKDILKGVSYKFFVKANNS